MKFLEKGFVKIHRSIFSGDLAKRHLLRLFFIDLIAAASWQETNVVFDGKKITVPPGTVLLGLQETAAHYGVVHGTISNWLKYLKNTGRVYKQSNNQGTIVTIRNYSEYQGHDAVGMKTDYKPIINGLSTDYKRIIPSEELRTKKEELKGNPLDSLERSIKIIFGKNPDPGMTDWPKRLLEKTNGDPKPIQDDLLSWFTDPIAKNQKQEFVLENLKTKYGVEL